MKLLVETDGSAYHYDIGVVVAVVIHKCMGNHA